MDWNQFNKQLEANNNQPPLWVYPITFAFYFCTYFVIIFCNSALASRAFMRFNGKTPTVTDGFRMALARLPQIFMWAPVSATVGLLLKVIENAREGGRDHASILGTAWSIMTYFVVPVLVVEKAGPFEAIGRSISLIKNTWGESLTGNMGLNFVMFLLAIPIVVGLHRRCVSDLRRGGDSGYRVTRGCRNRHSCCTWRLARRCTRSCWPHCISTHTMTAFRKASTAA